MDKYRETESQNETALIIPVDVLGDGQGSETLLILLDLHSFLNPLDWLLGLVLGGTTLRWFCPASREVSECAAG